VEYLVPSRGTLYGGTAVVAHGSGFRDFGELMRCKFGTEARPAASNTPGSRRRRHPPRAAPEQEVDAALTAPPGEFIDAFNHSQIACQAPASIMQEENQARQPQTAHLPAGSDAASAWRRCPSS
jgi:hypothetical protein